MQLQQYIPSFTGRETITCKIHKYKKPMAFLRCDFYSWGSYDVQVIFNGQQAAADF